MHASRWTGSILVALLLLIAPRAHAVAWFPVQGDLSAGGLYGRYDRHPTGSLYLGFAAMEDGMRQSSFFGGGVEGTISDYTAPYQWTAGLGSRVGMAFRWRESTRSTLPDFYGYARVTPIVGAGRQGVDLPNGNVAYGAYKVGGGVRVGLGFTSPGWTILLAQTGWRGLGSVDDVGHDDYTAIACAVGCATYLALTIINHGELTWEEYGTESRSMYGRIGFRIGTGF